MTLLRLREMGRGRVVRNGCKPGALPWTPLDSLRRKSSKGSLAEGGVNNVNSIFRAIND